MPPKKKFKSKYDIPELKDYKTDPGSDFWSKCPSVSWEEAQNMKSDIDANKLEKMASLSGFLNTDLLYEILKDIKEGASIGVALGMDVPSDSTNAPSALEFGHQVTDAICKMISEGFVMGPFDENNLPFENNRFSGIMTKLKPNNTARIILNLSRGFPHAVNDGIVSTDYPTLMSSTEEFVRMLFKAGIGAEITKSDWAAAYKQIRTALNEVWQQGFRWLGKVFYELCLVFGAKSAAGLFDRLAKLILHIVLWKCQMPARAVLQHLDDVCSASPAGSGRALRFHTCYQQVCTDLGVKLAPSGDPDKEFGPCTEGTVLGVSYCTTDFTWYLKEDKMSIILNLIQDTIENDEMTQRTVKKLCGKLIDIRVLIPNSRFYLANLIKDSNIDNENLESMVTPSDWTRCDLSWWKLSLPLCSKRTRLTDPDRRPLPSALKIYPDAAGGTLDHLGRGVGVVIQGKAWAYLPYRTKINGGFPAYDGKSLANKLSVWELVGPLLALVTAPELLKNKQAVAYVDNIGSVIIYKKGWSTVCNLANTIVRAIYLVATALHCDFWIEKITRCSNHGAEAADALSKCDYTRFLENMPGAEAQPRVVPSTLLAWMEDPVPDRELGGRILEEMSQSVELMGYSSGINMM